MPALELAGKKIETDGDGFLLRMEDWDESVACALAEKEGVEELTKDKMAIINFMRAYYKEYNAFPVLNGVCIRVHQPKDCVKTKFMDPVAAWKVAGLPKPDVHVIGELHGEGGVV